MKKNKCVQVFHKSWKFNYFFSYISDRIIGLLCCFQPSVVKKYVLEKHFKTRHSVNYLNYSNSEKLNVIEELKLVYQENSIPSIPCSLQKSLQVSYAVSLLIVQNSKSFMESVLKNCIILKQ